MEGIYEGAAELQVLFDDFIREQRNLRGARPATIVGYQSAFKLFVKLVPEADVRKVQDRNTWVGFFSTISERQRAVGRGETRSGVKNSTLHTYRSKLGTFMNWLFITKQINDNPLLKIKAPHVQYVDRRYLTRTEIQRIMQCVRYDYQWVNPFTRIRNYTILQVLLLTGIRRGELIGLRMGDVDLKKGELTVRSETSKSKMTRLIPISRELHVDLTDYLKARKDNPIAYTTDALFVSSTDDHELSGAGLKHFVDLVCKESGVHFHLHRARHTFAANLNDQGVSVAHVQQLLGHTDPRMTLRYGRCLTTKALRESIESIGSGSYID